MKLEATTRLKATQVNAAAIPEATQMKLLTQLFKNAKLKKFGLSLQDGAIVGEGLDADKVNAIGKNISGLGWTQRWRRGVALADGSWPLVVNVDKTGTIRIEVYKNDTLDKGDAKQAVKDYKAIVKEICNQIGAKLGAVKTMQGRRGAIGLVRNGKAVPPRVATKTLISMGYKKPTVDGNSLKFAKQHATVSLEYSEDKTTLVSITCEVV